MITHRIEGPRTIKLAFGEISRAAQRSTVSRAARAGAREVGLEARRLAPRSDRPTHPQGHAYKTIKWVQVERWPDRAVFQIGATDWGWYLWLHEVGTSRFAAQPWMQPALANKRQAAVSAAGDVFQDAVLTAARRAAARARR